MDNNKKEQKQYSPLMEDWCPISQEDSGLNIWAYLGVSLVIILIGVFIFTSWN
jgi:hypothetical protein